MPTAVFGDDCSKGSEMAMKVVSWNVNGLRACATKGFMEWLESSSAAVVGLQEVRALPEQLPQNVREPEGWYNHIFAAQRKGYSGVGLFMRDEPDEIVSELGIEEFDAEGRVQMARLGELLVVNAYFPNGNGKNRDLSRIPYKLRFYEHLRTLLLPKLEAGERILVMGDFNTAHEAIDLARPKANEKTSGFRPEEREAFGRWIADGWVDTFRHFDDSAGNYSWWSNRLGARERNVGWRIDYVLATPGAMEFVQAAAIHADVVGSDHCPVSVTLDARVTRPVGSPGTPTFGVVA